MDPVNLAEAVVQRWATLLRNFDQVELAPCTPRGKPTGPVVGGRARRLTGGNADLAERLLRSRYPVVYGALVPIELSLKRTHNVFYEIDQLLTPANKENR